MMQEFLSSMVRLATIRRLDNTYHCSINILLAIVVDFMVSIKDSGC
jgi:hypothetical protein